MRNMRFLDATGDYYLRKGMDLERQRERVLASYERSRNPKTLQLYYQIDKECQAIWTTVRLMSYRKYYYNNQ